MSVRVGSWNQAGTRRACQRKSTRFTIRPNRFPRRPPDTGATQEHVASPAVATAPNESGRSPLGPFRFSGVGWSQAWTSLARKRSSDRRRSSWGILSMPLGRLRHHATRPEQLEQLEFYFSACLTAAQSVSLNDLIRPQQQRVRIVSPSAFAVLRLITSSNFVGCSTGRSAGFAPFQDLVSMDPGSSKAPRDVADLRSRVRPQERSMSEPKRESRGDSPGGRPLRQPPDHRPR